MQLGQIPVVLLPVLPALVIILQHSFSLAFSLKPQLLESKNSVKNLS